MREQRGTRKAHTNREGSSDTVLVGDPEAWFTDAVGEDELAAEKIDALIEERSAAKASRDFQRADQIRDDLEAQGVVLEDGPDGTQWRRRS